MNVAFTIASLKPGGAERDLTGLANHWIELGWNVTIITYDGDTSSPFFPLHPGIRHVDLNIAKPYSGLIPAAFKNLSAVRQVRKTITNGNQDVVVSFGAENTIRAILATIGLGIPVIGTERSVVSELSKQKNGRIWALLRWIVYRRLSALVVLTEDDKEYFPKAIRKKTTVIPTCALTDLSLDQNNSRQGPILRKKTIAAMGRFVPEKRFDLLLRAFAQVVPGRDCYLALYGDGPLRNDLEQLAADYGLSDRLDMPGFVKEPWITLRHAYLFVVSSEVESFGNVIVEAMACGIPVVSFDCPNGPRTIIRDGIDGVLVPPQDVDALAQAILRLLDDEDLRNRLAQRTQDISRRFSQESVLAQWDAVIDSVLAKPAK